MDESTFAWIERLTDQVSNPFATRYVRPGAIAYHWPPGESAAALVERLKANCWRGEIVGPHGSGKSTLLAALVPALEAAGRRVLMFTLGEGARRLPRGRSQFAAAGLDTLVIVDGYEQLAGWARWMLRLTCRRRHCGLLVTAHRPSGMPRLVETRVEPQAAVEIVRELVGSVGQVDPREVLPALEASGGDLREALFHLYDVFEERRGQAGAAFDER
jgi:energy-coupling factor transporter ATP-binding protein EcfA2